MIYTTVTVSTRFFMTTAAGLFEGHEVVNITNTVHDCNYRYHGHKRSSWRTFGRGLNLDLSVSALVGQQAGTSNGMLRMKASLCSQASKVF